MKIVLTIFFFLILLFTNACKEKSENSASNTLKYNLAVGLSNLDPAFAKDLAATWACSHVYEGLFFHNAQTELEPLLVDSFWIEKDQMSYHFHLKQDVFFHKNKCFQSRDSTRAFYAYDVIYSLQRLLDPKTASPGSWVLRNKLDTSSPFLMIDSFHLIVKLRKPYAQFLQILAMSYCAIVPKEAVAFYGRDFRKNAVGTGPFRFKLWEDGQVLFLQRNENYHMKDSHGKALPYLDYVKITFNENKKTELFSFEKKDLSFITGLDQSILHQIFNTNGTLKLNLRHKMKLYKKPFLNTEYIAFYLKDSTSICRHKMIRKAINYSINRMDIVRHLKYHLATPAEKGYVAQGMNHYDTSFQGYNYQPEKAKDLLASMGFDRNHRPQITLSINNSMIELAEFIAHQLEVNGFSVAIKLHPADMMMQLAAEGKLEFFRRSWMADYPDPENFLACFYSKNGSPPNYTRFSNQTYDRLYENLLLESNVERRIKDTRRMEEILIEEAPIVPIYYEQSVRLVQNNIQGLEQNTVNSLDLRRVKIVHE